MAVEAVLFLDNLVDESVAASSIVSASATDNGYHRDNLRVTDFGAAWKATDSGAVNSEIILDIGSTSALGAAGTTAYFAAAYDPRGSNQANLHLQDNTNDDTNFADEHGLTTISIPDFTEPTSQYITFTITNPAKRYYRIKQAWPDGDKRLRIFSWGMYKGAGLIRIGTDYSFDTTGPGQIGQRILVSSIEVANGQIFTNRVARPQQEIEITLAPGTTLLWEAIRDKFYNIDGSARAIFAIFDGLRNLAQPNFGMVRLAAKSQGFRSDRDQYDMTMRFITEPTF